MRSKWSPPGVPEVSTVRTLHPFNPSAQNHDALVSSGAMMREQPWSSLQIKVDPYSMVHQTPEQRAQKIVGIIKDVALPLMPALQAQGINLDISRFFTMIGKFMDQPDLQDLLSINPPVKIGRASCRERV